jgi:signal transduction histidine kinase
MGPDPHREGDPELLCAMVSNLLRNAIHYSPPETAVEVEVSLSGPDAVITVRDRGPGIPPEDLERVFERFYRAPRPGDTFMGTGLGLAIARAVARLHRGEISARDRPGGGSEFVIRLPLGEREQNARG